jgi:hypothetical protein
MTNKFPVIFICIFISLFIGGCQRDEPVQNEPVRLSSIPAASIWVGGIDGGVFVMIKKLEESKIGDYFAEIFYVSGDLAYKGPMKINPLGSTFDFKKKESYEGWDGDNLYLNDNRYLQVIE